MYVCLCAALTICLSCMQAREPWVGIFSHGIEVWEMLSQGFSPREAQDMQPSVGS